MCTKSEIETVKFNEPCSIIVNLDNSDKSESHWCLCFIANNQKIYYLSFGDPISIEVKNWINEIDDRETLTSNFQIQDFNKDTCGLYCILILYLLNNGYKFEDIILSLVNEE